MANKEHVEILRQGAATWNKWRAFHPYATPDLGGVDLRGESLTGVDLGGANLISANFVRANLNNARLNYARLNDAHLNGVRLRNASLSGAYLWGASLIEADLAQADLSRANLTDANLSGANLSRANLTDSNLSGANLSNADLTQADLTRTYLTGTNLYSAELNGAILNNSRFGYTLLADVDLSSAIGLERTRHFAPSSISVDTLDRSRGAIPELFLRGVGLSEIFIQYLPPLVGKPTQFYSCFISYSHTDKAFARRLHDTLQGRGIRCWLDDHELLPGDDIYEQVDIGIRLWDKVLLCCSKHSLTSWWVDNEVAIAFEKEQVLFRERGKKVLALVPLNLDGFMFSKEWVSGKKRAIKSRLAADFTGWEEDNSKFEQEFERLIKALQTGGTGRDIPPQPQL